MIRQLTFQDMLFKRKVLYTFIHINWYKTFSSIYSFVFNYSNPTTDNCLRTCKYNKCAAQIHTHYF